MSARLSFRQQFLLGFVACAGLMGYALYAQHVQGYEPCPLCVFQRIAVMALGFVFLLGAAFAPKRARGRAAWGLLAIVAAGTGAAIAGRHVWLQNLPADQVPACGPPLEFMRETLPLADVVQKVLRGSGECATIDWRFLGLSMPGWTLICFIALALWAAHAALRRRPSIA